MPDGATVIGRISIKVYPDTSDFRRDVKRALAAEEREIDPFEIHFEADVEQAVQQVKKAVDEAEKAVDKQLKIKVDLADTASLEAGLAKIDAELAKLKETEVKVDLNEDELKRVKDDIEHKLSEAKAQVKVDLNSFSLREAAFSLSVLARKRFVDIAPEVNKAAATKAAVTISALSGGRVFSDVGHDALDSIGSLDQAIPAITRTSLAVTNLSSAALVATSNVASLGAGLAATAGAGFALPGIFGGIAIGLGVALVAFKDFNKELPGVGKRFSALGDDISKNFYAKAKAPFQSFINDIFPQFAAGIRETATALGGFFANIATSSKGALDGALGKMFDGLNKSIEVFSHYTDSLLDVIVRLGNVGAGNLPRLATYVGGLIDRFDGFLQRQGPAGIQHFIDVGVNALQDLGGIIANTSSIFAGLATAADKAGGSTLHSLRETLNSAANTVNSAQFQKALVGVFKGAQTAIDELTSRSGPQFKSFVLRLSDTLTNVLPTAGRAAGDAFGAIFDALDQPQVQAATERLFTSIEKSIGNLAKPLPAVALALSAIADVVGQLAVSVSQSLSTALSGLAPSLATLAKRIQPLIAQFSALFQNIVEGGIPVINFLADSLGSLAGVVAALLAPINGLLDAMQSLPAPIKSVLTVLASVGVLVAGGAWLGAGVAAKVSALGVSMVSLGEEAAIGGGALTRFGTAAQTMGTKLGSLKGLAFAGAGIAALGATAGSSSKDVQFLGQVASGALIGAAFGPEGALVGGAIGAGTALFSLSHSTDAAKESMNNATPAAVNYADSLRGVLGVATDLTRQQADAQLASSGLYDALSASGHKLGLSQRDLVNALTGTDSKFQSTLGTIEAYVQSLQDIRDKGGTLTASQTALLETTSGLGAKLKDLRAEFENQRDSYQRLELATGSLNKIYKLLPKGVVTKIGQVGAKLTLNQLENLTTKYKLTPKQVRTAIDLANVHLSQQQIDTFIKQLKNAGKIKVKPKIDADTKDATNKIKDIHTDVDKIQHLKGLAAVEVDDKATKPIGLIQKRLETVARTKVHATVTIVDEATAKIRGILTLLDHLATRTVRPTVTTTYHSVYTSNKGGKTTDGPSGRIIAGPGRETNPVAVQATLEAVIAASLAGARQISAYLRDGLKARFTDITNAYKQLLQKAGKAGAEKYRKAFADEIDALHTKSTVIDHLLTAFDKAKDKLTGLRDQLKQFKAGVVDAFQALADPVALGASTYDGLIRGLQSQAEKANQFADATRALIKAGLNKTTLQQLISDFASSPDEALNAAQQILSGGVDQVNQLQEQITKAGQDVADNAGNKLYANLIKQAAKDFDSLVNQLKKLQKGLREQVRELLDAIKDELQKELKKGDPKPKKHASTATKRAILGNDIVPNSGDTSTSTDNSTVIVNYHAAPGTASFTAQESLFDALGVAQGGGF